MNGEAPADVLVVSYFPMLHPSASLTETQDRSRSHTPRLHEALAEVFAGLSPVHGDGIRSRGGAELPAPQRGRAGLYVGD